MTMEGEMRRFLCALICGGVLTLLAVPTSDTAQAGWYGRGYYGGWGYRGWGYRGWGYRGWGYRSYYRPFYRPYYGYYRPYYRPYYYGYPYAYRPGPFVGFGFGPFGFRVF